MYINRQKQNKKHTHTLFIKPRHSSMYLVSKIVQFLKFIIIFNSTLISRFGFQINYNKYETFLRRCDE